jgi:hypothetical protein
MNKLLNLKLVLCLFFIITSCSSLKEDRKNISSGLVGCSPKSIIITESKDSTWKAVCKKRTYYCSNVGDDETSFYACKSVVKSMRKKRKKRAKIDLGF